MEASLVGAAVGATFQLLAYDAGVLLTTTNNVLMLGSHNYIQIGAIIGATTSSMPNSVRNSWTDVQRGQALEDLMNEAVANGSETIFNLNPLGSKAGQWLQYEAQCILSLGYQIVQNSDGTLVVQK